MLIEDQANELIGEITIFERQAQNLDLLPYFKGILPGNDLEILRAALFIKNIYDKGGQVGELKRDVIIRHGDRGRNIVNLCTAGYFSTVIKPLYEEMSKLNDFTIERFIAVYNTIIMNSPFALFVNTHTSVQELENEVKNKVDFNRKYGIDYLNLHAIGEENIDKLATVIKKFESEYTHRPTIDSGKGYIIVTIWF